jgi:hypothetical protein
MTFLVVLVAVVGVFFVVRRARKRAGVTITRNFTVEPPAGRMGHRKGERL